MESYPKIALERDRKSANNQGPSLRFPLERVVHHLFEEQVERTPHALAAVHGNTHLTYRDLNGRANRLARFLRKQGVVEETLVALAAERSLDFITAVLAVFKTGGAYLPLDPLHPAARTRQVLSQSRSPLVLTTSTHLPNLSSVLTKLKGAPQVFLIRDGYESTFSEENLEVRVKPSGLAYVIFTSGSTGLPKGAMVEHRGMLNHLFVKITDLNLKEGDIVAQNASQCFDISVWQFLAALLVGGCINIFNEDESKNPLRTINKLQREAITVFETVPSMLRVMLEILEEERSLPNLSSMRWLLSTGEALPPDLCRRWLKLFPATPLLNAYGPTECSDDVTHYTVAEVPPPDLSHIPIGYPVANVRLYIARTDCPHLELCPPGVSGELCVGGVGVGRGYLNDPIKTKAAFYRDPFTSDPHARLYRTGDLVQRLPDGALRYLGRLDRQVKIRGNRIELDEVEAVLQKQKNVGACTVVARSWQSRKSLVARECIAEIGYDQAQSDRLVAYVVLREKTSSTVLKAALEQVLPAYMIPDQFVFLETLPLTENGKVDVKALPRPESLRPEVNERFVAPRAELEALVASTWREVLAIDRVGVKDNFFELGGDSLLAMQMLNRVRSLTGAELSFQHLADNQTVAAFSNVVRGAKSKSPTPRKPNTHAEPGARHPLSLAQQGLWFLWKVAPENSYYTFQGLLDIKGELEASALNRAWLMLCDRHEVLRAQFGEENGQPFQLFRSQQVPDIAITDLMGLPEQARHHSVRQRAEAEGRSPFDLENDRLIRIELFKVGEKEHVALLTMHEIIIDGWATNVLVRELAAIYSKLLAGDDEPLSPPELTFGEYVRWEKQLQEESDIHASYWRERLAGELPALDLPLDYLRKQTSSYRGGAVGILLNPELSQKLKWFCSQQKVTLFNTLLTAFYVFLHSYSGQRDLIVGAPVAARQQKETENLVGYLLNMLPLRVSISPHERFVDLLESVRKTVTGAITHASYPFVKMVESADAVRDPSVAPVFQVMFNMLSFPHVSLEVEELKMNFREIETGYTKYDLALYGQEHGEQIYLQLSYQSDLFDVATVRRMSNTLTALLASAMENPRAPISDLAVMNNDEEKAALKSLNGTSVAYQANTSIHELFEAQVEKTPDATALIYQGEHTNYTELNQQANRLAHHLREVGVGPETLVAVCTERGPEMVVALLSVIKAGGAYVALDQQYPVSRLQDIVNDTNPPVLILRRQLDHFADYGGRKIYIDRDWLRAGEDSSNLGHSAGLDKTFNVMYTSSSTGKPKGVMITERSVINRLRWMWDAHPFCPEDVVVWQKSYALVAAAWEFLGGLLKGVPTLLLQHEDLLDPAEFWSKLASNNASFLTASPPILRGLIDQAVHHPEGLKTLRLATTSAEPIPPTMVTDWYRAFPQVPLLNLYGSTECSSNVTQFDTRLMEPNAARVPIGVPLPNTKIYVMNDQQKLVPMGAVGEMCVAGACVARSYLNLPEKSQAQFVPNPFVEEGYERLYRTGDLARYRADGNLELLGRRDHQVKMRGFRIELGDVEKALAAHAKVRICACEVFERADQSKQLIAYLTLSVKAVLKGDELRDFLRTKLPEYMIPSQFVVLDALPKTPNGKVNRLALPTPGTNRPELTEAFTAPRNEVETAVAAIWSDTLQLERIGVYDNFFDLGGHSLLATQIVSRVRELYSTDLPLSRLFEAPTVAGLAKYLATTRWLQQGSTVPPSSSSAEREVETL